MPASYIPGFPGPAFDLFDALGLEPRPSYTDHDIKVAWRAAFRILHSDKKHINGKYVPKFPTVDQITRAKDWLLEDSKNVETAYEALAEDYRSTWNPHAKPGTSAVLQPIPGAVAEPLQSLPIRDDRPHFRSRSPQRMPRAATAAEHRHTRAARETNQYVYPSSGERHDPRPWRERRQEADARAQEGTSRSGLDASKVIDEMLNGDPSFEEFLQANKVWLR